MLTTPKLDPLSLTPPFEDSMPASLGAFGEQSLRQFHTLARETYSTERFLSGSSFSPGNVVGSVSLGNVHPLYFEAYSQEVMRYCTQHAVCLADDTEARMSIGIVRDALTEIIHPHSFLWNAVRELVWRCHILRASNDDYDVSFSDPSVPFSIFISTPRRLDRRSILRVAENLVHEAMHLQLTLFELCCPLVETGSYWSMYSPWQRQERPAQGILHGLYVFSVLRWMWAQVSATAQHQVDRNFAIRRVLEIDEDIASVRALGGCPVLTEAGSSFIQKLLSA